MTTTTVDPAAELAALAAAAEADVALEEKKAAPVKKAKPSPKNLIDLSTIAPIVRPRRPEDSFTALFYGPPKVGKTLLSGTAADVEELSPVLFLAIEDGSSVLAQSYGDNPNIDVIELEDYVTAVNVINAVASGNTKYRTVIVDTYPELMNLNKEYITKGARQLSLPEWGVIADNAIATAKLLHRSPVNAIFLAHSGRVKDDDSGKVMTSPIFLGNKTGPEILKVVDVIGLMGIGKTESGESVRVLQVLSDGKIDAGDRFGKLDSQIVEPTMSEVYAQLTA